MNDVLEMKLYACSISEELYRQVFWVLQTVVFEVIRNSSSLYFRDVEVEARDLSSAKMAYLSDGKRLQAVARPILAPPGYLWFSFYLSQMV